MAIYSLIADRNTEFQTVLDKAPELLLKKGLYEIYSGNEIDCIYLDKKAVLTDVLSNGTLNLKGHIISEKFYNIIKKFRLHQVQFVDLKNLQLKGYKFMFFNGDLTSEIDYDKSNFKVIKVSPIKTKVLDIEVPKNREGVLNLYRQECARSVFKKIQPQLGYFFKTSFNVNDYDIFRIGHFDKSFYISDRIKEELVSSGITGVEYIEEELFNSSNIDI